MSVEIKFIDNSNERPSSYFEYGIGLVRGEIPPSPTELIAILKDELQANFQIGAPIRSDTLEHIKTHISNCIEFHMGEHLSKCIAFDVKLIGSQVNIELRFTRVKIVPGMREDGLYIEKLEYY